MTIKELMELIGETRFNYVKKMLDDGLNEIQLVTKENVTQYTTNLEEDTAAYNLPSNLVEVTDVKIQDTESGYFIPIPRVIIKGYREK
tara:strand:+ start:2709 stop:2972 length:264 start_codon:yes stop_codon:yes gene_type:complete